MEDMKPFYVWITGWSCVGKTTLANLLVGAIRKPTVLVDGDIIRAAAGRSIFQPFSREDRRENVYRAARISKSIMLQGKIPIISLISPYAEERKAAYTAMCYDGLVVHLSAPVEVLRQRDQSGRYDAAIAGNLDRFTGITDPYEDPADDEKPLRINTATTCVNCACDMVLWQLNERGLLESSSEYVGPRCSGTGRCDE